MVDETRLTGHDDGTPNSKRQRVQPGTYGRRKRGHEEIDASLQAQQSQSWNEFLRSSENKALENLPVEPISASLEKYKLWREEGSPHDFHCFECFGDRCSNKCETCRNMYDGFCAGVSSTSVQNGRTLWYCPVCIKRGWHKDPPRLPGDIDAPRTEFSMQYSSGGKVLRSIRPPRSSSFALPDTLPREVETALRVVYRELESVPLLQRRIDNLNSSNSHLEEVVQYQQNKAVEVRKAAEARASQAEIPEADIEALKARNKQLEEEKEKALTELDKMKKSMDTWKRKLAILVDD